MTRSLLGATLFAALAAGVPQPAGGFRGGGFGGFHGGGAWHAGAGGSMPGTLAASMASGAEPGTPMAGTPAAFMLTASTVQRSSRGVAGTVALRPLPVQPLAQRR
jgi:hypothetical protein